MALQTANQYQLGTDFSRLGSGIQQGQQIANQFQLGQQNKAIGERNTTKFDQEQSTIRATVLNKLATSMKTVPPEQRQAFLQNQAPELAKFNIDASVFAQEPLDDASLDEAIAGTQSFIAQKESPSAFEQAQTGKILKQTELLNENGNVEIGTASQRDFNTYQDLLKTDPDKAEIFGRQAGFIRSTDQEKADIKVDEAVRKEVAKANTKRVQGYIDSGIDVADSAANIIRSLDLLKTVKTGGYDNAALKAKQFFGIESGDEAELSANLGKNVLAQLKPIFGSAFTEKEGQRLETIEAGFGKSTAGNIRLLENALTIVDRAARRGIAAAEDQGDEFTANEIRNVLATIQSNNPEKKKQEALTLGDELEKQGMSDAEIVKTLKAKGLL